MSPLQPDTFDHWLLDETPDSGVVVSSRARVARNMPRQPFAPRANPEQLRYVAQRVADSIDRMPRLSRFSCYEMDKIPPEDRCFLRESYLISTDLEKGGSHRVAYLGPDRNASLMINEEDHLRLATLISGSRIEDAYRDLTALEEELEQTLQVAFSDEFGYLTACPTNTGTGLRCSVLMHLPALTMLEEIELTLADLGGYGLVVRGAYGEHTENIGDLYQISNEVTLGKSEEDLMEILQRIVRQIIERELDARQRLLRERRERLEDFVCRAVGVLAGARRIDSMEAITLLSRARLGIGHSWGVNLTHPQLSRLFVQIQPAHLQCLSQGSKTPTDRDQERASLLRSIFGGNPNPSMNN
jgi:protein arginine kinase